MIFRISLAGFACSLLVACDPGTDPKPSVNAVSVSPALGGRWEAAPLDNPSTKTSKISLEFPAADSLVIVNWSRSAAQDAWRVSDTIYAAKIDRMETIRWHLTNLRGKMARRNTAGWVRVESFRDGLAFFLNSFQIVAVQADTQSLVGTWTMNDNYKVAPGVVTLKADSTWQGGSATSPETGSWMLAPLATAGTRTLDASLAAYLNGKEILSAFSSAYLIERTGKGVWLDQYGDGALVFFREVP